MMQRENSKNQISYTANKKLNESEIAYKTNNVKKAQKLHQEAQALFEQDWKAFFNNEDFYQIESHDNNEKND